MILRARLDGRTLTVPIRLSLSFQIPKGEFMDPIDQRQLLLKIVIGSAWIDGRLDPSELEYMEMLLRRYALAQDPGIQQLLQKPISPEQTELWMVEFLNQANEEERLQLLGAVGNLLIADDNVSPEEHDLLDDYHTLMANIPPQVDSAAKLVETIGQFVRKMLSSLQSRH